MTRDFVGASVPSSHAQDHVGLGGMLVELLGALAAVLVVMKMLQYVICGTISFRRKVAASYVPMEAGLDPATCIVTDCTARKGMPTLTHHKDNNNPKGLKPADTSTGLVLNAIKTSYWLGGEAYSYVQRPTITTNHFDIDSFLSVWCYCNRALALVHEPVLRHMARVGDFREAFLSPEYVAQHGAADGLRSIRDAFTALKLACWVNTVEKRMFSAPYETKDCEVKMGYFLQHFAAVLQDPESAWSDWQDEYRAVVGGFDALAQGADCGVDTVKKVGLTILRCPEPLHYYSLFSHTVGSDVVLSIYDHQRYEVECKYTQFVEVHSRPVWPRLDMAPLATVLNSIEVGLPPGCAWVANRFTETGPLLRLQREGEGALTKAQRYGHPCDRPFTPSSIPETTLAAIVTSFLEYGLQGLRPRRGGWSWAELQAINAQVPWQAWVNTVLEQHACGELTSGAGARPTLLPMSPSRRISGDHAVSLAPPLQPYTLPALSDNGSSILCKDDIATLAALAVPARFAQAKWSLAYCTQRDGISLHTLYRKAAGKAPSLLVIKDNGGFIFGAYAAEPWHIAPRFYGTGETHVFQLHPMRALFPWRRAKDGSLNDFFQFSAHEGLGVGGSGHFALWLDTDLFEGTSAPCETFASPCLAHAPDFHVHCLELWHLV